MRRRRRGRNADLGRNAGQQRTIGVGDLQLDPERTGRLVGLRGDVAHAARHRLAGDQARLAGASEPDAVPVLLGDVTDHQDRVLLEDAPDRVAVVHVVADLDHALIEPAGERRQQPVFARSTSTLANMARAASRPASAAASALSVW